MTRVLIPAPDIEADITAEQVVAYLLRPGSGWRRARYIGSPWEHFLKGDCHIEILHDGRHGDSYSLSTDVQTVALAEGRHPSAVLADIEGPVRGVGGRACGDKLMGAPWVAQTKCLMAGWPEEKRKSAMRNFLAFASELDDDDDGDTAPHGADEGSE